MQAQRKKKQVMRQTKLQDLKNKVQHCVLDLSEICTNLTKSFNAGQTEKRICRHRSINNNKFD